MSYTYLQEQGEESSVASFVDIPASVLSRLNLTREKCCCSGSETESCHGSPYGTTSAPLTANHGGDTLTSCAVGSHAKVSAAPPAVGKKRITCGRKCSELWEMSAHGLFSARTSATLRSGKHRPTLKVVDLQRGERGLMRKTWAQTILGKDFGYLPTPTATANWDSPSMAKWPCCRNAQLLFGKVSPTSQEYMMGWPPKWTAVEPLETDKFQQWLLSHGESLLNNK